MEKNNYYNLIDFKNNIYYKNINKCEINFDNNIIEITNFNDIIKNVNNYILNIIFKNKKITSLKLINDLKDNCINSEPCNLSFILLCLLILLYLDDLYFSKHKYNY